MLLSDATENDKPLEEKPGMQVDRGKSASSFHGSLDAWSRYVKTWSHPLDGSVRSDGRRQPT